MFPGKKNEQSGSISLDLLSSGRASKIELGSQPYSTTAAINQSRRLMRKRESEQLFLHRESPSNHSFEQDSRGQLTNYNDHYSSVHEAINKNKRVSFNIKADEEYTGKSKPRRQLNLSVDCANTDELNKLPFLY